jgi:hypothetical protein
VIPVLSVSDILKSLAEEAEENQFRARDSDARLLILGRYLVGARGADLLGADFMGAVDMVFRIYEEEARRDALGRELLKNKLSDLFKGNGFGPRLVQDGNVYWGSYTDEELQYRQIIIVPHWTVGLVKRRIELMSPKPRGDIARLAHKHVEQYR